MPRPGVRPPGTDSEFLFFLEQGVQIKKNENRGFSDFSQFDVCFTQRASSKAKRLFLSK